MKNIILFSIIFFFALGISQSFAQAKPDTTKADSKNFVDENGDGYNDNAPDHDGDGIPNGLDKDYKALKARHGKGFVDLNGDGINDNSQQGEAAGKGEQKKFGQGKGENGKGVGTKSGNGYGYGSGNTGDTGDKGKKRKGRK